jgi:hypothetical protein
MYHYLFLLTILCSNCNSKKQVEATPGFSYFELSYHTQWGAKGLSFFTDSNGIFILPQFLQTVEGNNVTYGLLPDSIYQTIDTIAREIKNYRSQDPDSLYCHDCDEISVMIVTNTDTARVYQAGNVSPRLYKLVEMMESLKKTKGFHRFSVAYFFMETQKDVIRPPKVITE